MLQVNNLFSLNLSGLRKAVRSQLASFYRTKFTTKLYISFLVGLLILAVAGPMIAPYEAGEFVFADGDPKVLEPPSLEHPLGTNGNAQDIFSRLLIGTRPSVITGFLGGGLIIGIGSAIGIASGYYGGLLDSVLMRFTDFMYSAPMIPTAILLLAFVGSGLFLGILIISVILWRSSARILRSQVLQIKQRPYVEAARADGASDFRIMSKHIVPNMIPMVSLLYSLAVGYAILAEASLSFLGLLDPFVPTWGVMIRNAYASGRLAHAWWWSLTPGALLATTIFSVFMLGRRIGKREGVTQEDIGKRGGL